jgi:Flp pilus assembly protein TadD
MRSHRCSSPLIAGLLALVPLSVALDAPVVHAAPTVVAGKTLSLKAKDSMPKEGRLKPTPEAITAMRKAVADAPDDRGKRFELVRGLMAYGDLTDALKEAQAWRAKDAYNLVVVRLLGDIYTEMGDKERARRAYSAIVELVPKDAEAQRALATVLKQGGDLDGAHARLLAAMKLRPDDARMGFELADVAQRLGRLDEAKDRFEAIVAAKETNEAVRYPAKQRLAQIYAKLRRDALDRKDDVEAKKQQALIDGLALEGGSINDLKVYLSWDTDRTDVDLWVTTPGKEKVKYDHKKGKNGEALFGDVTNGYGPESFTAKTAQPGKYVIEVNYFGTSRTVFTEARGEIVVVLHEGTAQEERHVLPYQMFAPKQTVTVAEIEVK